MRLFLFILYTSVYTIKLIGGNDDPADRSGELFKKKLNEFVKHLPYSKGKCYLFCVIFVVEVL
jgi:hypothetical protein